MEIYIYIFEWKAPNFRMGFILYLAWKKHAAKIGKKKTCDLRTCVLQVHRSCSFIQSIQH